MKRLHVHVAVDNLSDSIGFYSKMFAVEPTVLKDDYAKWMLDDPRVNFAISQRGRPAGLDHLGIQVESAGELDEMQARLTSLQPVVAKEADVSCCYAKSDKYWSVDPSGIAWESFHTLGSVPMYYGGETTEEKSTEEKSASACCAPAAVAVPMPRVAASSAAAQRCGSASAQASGDTKCC
jgi:hypothetical protein